MYTGLQHLHSYLAYLVLITIVVAIIVSFSAWLSGKPFTDKSRKLALPALITTHLQWLFGVVLYFVSPLGFNLFSTEGFMSNAVTRLYAVEHPFTMILGVVLITIGFARAKRGKDAKKQHFSIWAFYLAGLILILSRIPWQTWP
jgi:uncharacterized Tic20 family protein